MTTKTTASSLALLSGSENHNPHTAFHPHFNEQQLAARWGISVKKLQADRLKGGSIPFVRIGRAVRYRYADVLEWEERHLRTSTSCTVEEVSNGQSTEHKPAAKVRGPSGW